MRNREICTAAKIPILHDCAAGIATYRSDRERRRFACRSRPQRRLGHRVLTLSCEVRCVGLTGTLTKAERISEGCLYYIAGSDELVSESSSRFLRRTAVELLAFKRAAPVYPTASAAVQVSLEGDRCREIDRLGLRRPVANSSSRRGIPAAWPADAPKLIQSAAEAARAAAIPAGYAGSAEYSDNCGALVKRATEAALERPRATGGSATSMLTSRKKFHPGRVNGKPHSVQSNLGVCLWNSPRRS